MEHAVCSDCYYWNPLQVAGSATEHCPVMTRDFARGSDAFCLKLKVNSSSHLLPGQIYPLNVIMKDIISLSRVHLLHKMFYSWYLVILCCNTNRNCLLILHLTLAAERASTPVALTWRCKAEPCNKDVEGHGSNWSWTSELIWIQRRKQQITRMSFQDLKPTLSLYLCGEGGGGKNLVNRANCSTSRSILTSFILFPLHIGKTIFSESFCKWVVIDF